MSHNPVPFYDDDRMLAFRGHTLQMQSCGLHSVHTCLYMAAPVGGSLWPGNLFEHGLEVAFERVGALVVRRGLLVVQPAVVQNQLHVGRKAVQVGVVPALDPTLHRL